MKGWTQDAIDRLSLKKTEKEKVKRSRLRVKTLPELIKELDEIFSIYVRRSNEDENGIIKCFTCGRLMTFKTAQNGHYIGRQYKALRWSIDNTSCQCYTCNCLHEGEKEKFGIALNAKYGAGHTEMLNQKKNNRFKLERFELSLLIDEYKKKVASLAHNT